MKRKKIIPDPILMVIAILAITAFQVYWLVQNYAREEKTLAIKSEAGFREAIMRLQVAKLKLDGLKRNGKDSSGRRMKFVMKDDVEEMQVHNLPKEEIITTINVIRNKLKDSPDVKGAKQGVFISMNKSSLKMDKDSIHFERKISGEPGTENHIFNVLYGVDSLQDSLRLKEIDSVYRKTLLKDKLDIPFTIIKLDSTKAVGEPGINEVTVGFAHPVRYKLQLGNTFPYLLRQILQPILFSILLLGITILAFVLMYKNLLRQRRMAAEKNEFISNITHELKTPIATVGVAIEALQNFNAMEDPQRTKEYLNISKNELQRLALIVDKVLQLSMFENKEVELQYEKLDLGTIVAEVVSSLKLQLERHRAKLTVTQEGDLTMSGDRMHLLSVVFNLLDNALKYSKDEPVINVDLKGQDNTIVLAFLDTGIGIAPEYKDKVFEKFFRVPHGDTHNAKGYGLGLSYVVQVIQKHGGSIVMQSEPGTGTTFTITIPKTVQPVIGKA